MAYSRVVKIGDGVSTQFAVNFALDYITPTHVTARVGNEADGSGNPIYRAITFLSTNLLQIAGAPAGIGVRVVFDRTVPKTDLIVNYSNGDILDERNLDITQKQAIMAVQEVLDGRFSVLTQDLDMGGFKVKNNATPTQPNEVANKAYVDNLVGDLGSLSEEIAIVAGLADELEIVSTNQASIATVAGIAGSVSTVALNSALLTGAASALYAVEDVFVGDGITINWPLSRIPVSAANVDLWIGGAIQTLADYTVASSTLVITPAVASGVPIVARTKVQVSANQVYAARDEAVAAALSAVTALRSALYDSRAQAITQTIPMAITAVTTGGYYVGGDGGHGIYKRVGSLPSHAAYFTDAAGQYFALVPDAAGINVRQLGAKGDGTTDDRVAIQNTITYAESYGVDILLPYGRFAVSGTSSGADKYCIKLNGESSLRGRGNYSQLLTMSGVAADVNTIWVKPSTQIACFTIGDFFIGGTTAVGGRRQGLHGIYIDTRTASTGCAKNIIERMQILQGYHDATSTSVPGPGKAIYHANNQTNNVNGGVFGEIIRDCRNLGGGVEYSQSGDQNQIKNCILSGDNNASLGYVCVGVTVELCTSDGGAGFFTMEDLTIVCKGGAYDIRYAVNFTAERVYCENFGAAVGIPYTRVNATTGYALAIVNSAGSTIGGGRISGNRFAPQGGVSTLITANLYIGNASQIVLTDDNTFYAATGTNVGVELDSSSYDCCIGYCKFLYFGGVAYRVSDSGSRNQCNVYTGIVPYVGWTAPGGSGYPALFAYRNSKGEVRLSGLLFHAGATSGTDMFVLPPGYRPVANRIFSVYATNGSGVIGGVTVNASGAVVYSGATATIVDVGSISFLNHDPSL